MRNNYKVLADDYFGNIMIVCKSLLVGMFAGGIAVIYRIILSNSEDISLIVYRYIRHNLIYIPLALAVLCLAGYFVGCLVAKDKMISGSGIPQIEGILRGYFDQRRRWFVTLLYKFLGGAIAIGAGLSLGREGPSIQLGACAAEGLGNRLGSDRFEKKILMASGASAGLSAAFNAPMAGVVFALEEIFKYFSPVILLSLMSAAVAADFISKQVFGLQPIFDFEITKTIPLSSYWILVLLGVILGLMGALYNFVLLKTKDLYEKMTFLTVKTRSIIPFVLAGVAGLFFPVILGAGHQVIAVLTIQSGIGMLFMILLAKFAFSTISFGSGVPGGIFFPLIVLGATIGAIFAGVSIRYFGFSQELFNNFIVLAMAGYFTAIVRAPITGIVLIMEMTGSFSHILPLTVVAVTAYVIADLVKSPPVYESLLERLIVHEDGEEKEESSKKIVVELIVKNGSQFGNQRVKSIKWPGNSLLVGVKHGEKQIIPKGDTIIKEGDFLTILTDIHSESHIKEILSEMNEYP